MEAATKSVIDHGKGLREATRLYNVPIETLRGRVTGLVHWSSTTGMSSWTSYCP